MSDQQPAGAAGQPGAAGGPTPPPAGPPPAGGYPPASYPPASYPPAAYAPGAVAPGPPARGRVGVVIVSIIAVLALIAAGVAVYLVVRPEPSEAGEVFLDAAEQPGPDPFTTQLTVTPLPSTTSTTSTTAAPTTTGAVTTVNASVGSQPGLYGGTQNAGRCDPNQLVTFLEANPDKAAAWVQALNGDPSLRWSGGTQVQVGQIRAYVKELTPLTLTVDTRVTNYGYANGRPTPRQAVLQRGTAVLVDAYGVPRTKCGCGNPLTKPVAVRTAPTYRGPTWPGWNPATVVVVQQTTIVITTFVMVNLAGPGYLDRPAGSTGDRDTPSTYTGGAASGAPGTTGPPTSATAPSTASPTTPPSTVAPTTPSTAPVSTLPPSDFCAQFAALQAKWANVTGDTPAQRQELVADFDRLAAAAPAEVSADMHLIADYVRVWINSDTFPEPTAEEKAAEQRVTAYLKNVCGITVG